MIASCIITFFRVGVATQAPGLGYFELEMGRWGLNSI